MWATELPAHSVVWCTNDHFFFLKPLYKVERARVSYATSTDRFHETCLGLDDRFAGSFLQTQRAFLTLAALPPIAAEDWNDKEFNKRYNDRAWRKMYHDHYHGKIDILIERGLLKELNTNSDPLVASVPNTVRPPDIVDRLRFSDAFTRRRCILVNDVGSECLRDLRQYLGIPAGKLMFFHDEERTGMESPICQSLLHKMNRAASDPRVLKASTVRESLPQSLTGQPVDSTWQVASLSSETLMSTPELQLNRFRMNGVSFMLAKMGSSIFRGWRGNLKWIPDSNPYLPSSPTYFSTRQIAKEYGGSGHESVSVFLLKHENAYFAHGYVHTPAGVLSEYLIKRDLVLLDMNSPYTIKHIYNTAMALYDVTPSSERSTLYHELKAFFQTFASGSAAWDTVSSDNYDEYSFADPDMAPYDLREREWVPGSIPNHTFVPQRSSTMQDDELALKLLRRPEFWWNQDETVVDGYVFRKTSAQYMHPEIWLRHPVSCLHHVGNYQSASNLVMPRIWAFLRKHNIPDLRSAENQRILQKLHRTNLPKSGFLDPDDEQTNTIVESMMRYGKQYVQLA